MPSPDKLTDADYWDRHWQNLPGARVISPRHGEYGRDGILVRVLRRHLPAIEGLRVVELGGGSSYRLLTLAKWLNARTTAVDFSAEGLETLRALYAANGCQADVALADVLSWDGDGRRFDLVVHWGLLEHFTDPVPLLRKCAELLAPGGTLLFSVPNMEAWGARLWRRRAPENWSRHVHHPDASIRAACAAAGLQLEAAFHFGYPMLHITDWERPGPVGRVVSRMLARLLWVLAAVGWIVPLYHRGLRRISSERGFVARRAPSA